MCCLVSVGELSLYHEKPTSTCVYMIWTTWIIMLSDSAGRVLSSVDTVICIITFLQVSSLPTFLPVRWRHVSRTSRLVIIIKTPVRQFTWEKKSMKWGGWRMKDEGWGTRRRKPTGREGQVMMSWSQQLLSSGNIQIVCEQRTMERVLYLKMSDVRGMC